MIRQMPRAMLCSARFPAAFLTWTDTAFSLTCKEHPGFLPTKLLWPMVIAYPDWGQALRKVTVSGELPSPHILNSAQIPLALAGVDEWEVGLKAEGFSLS